MGVMRLGRNQFPTPARNKKRPVRTNLTRTVAECSPGMRKSPQLSRMRKSPLENWRIRHNMIKILS